MQDVMDLVYEKPKHVLQMDLQKTELNADVRNVKVLKDCEICDINTILLYKYYIYIYTHISTFMI